MNQDEYAQEESASESDEINQQESVEVSSKSFRELYLPSQEFLITPLIILLNVLVFVVMVMGGVDAFQPSIQDLLDYGANFRNSTFGDQEYWRLLTSNYLHIGVFHLALNMYALLVVGRDLEKAVGKLQFILLYTFTGVIASLASVTNTDYVVSAGASGAIFGTYGYFIVMLLSKQIDLEPDERKRLLSSLGIFIAYNLVFGFSKANVDNAAHIGGLLSGAILSALFFLMKNKHALAKGIIWSTTSLLIVVFIGWIPSLFDGKYSDFQKDLEKLGEEEQYGLSILNNIYALKERDAGRDLLDSSLRIWEKNKQLYEAYSKESDLPAGVRVYALKISEYSELRLQQCEAIDSFYLGLTYQLKLDNRLQTLDMKINTVIDEMNLDQ